MQGLTGPVHMDELGSKGHGKPVEGLNSRALLTDLRFPVVSWPLWTSTGRGG